MPAFDIKGIVRRVASLVNWPLLLIGPAAMALVYILRAAGLKALLEKPLHEALAICLLGLALALASARLAVARRPLTFILAYITLVLFCREIHFAGSDNLLYGSVPAVLLWMWLWRERTRADWDDRRLSGLFILAMSLYFLSQLVARRVFRHILPNERKMHVPLEEFVETAGHVAMVLLFLLPRWKRKE